jgi:branched-chain amino acid transport system permease protein
VDWNFILVIIINGMMTSCFYILIALGLTIIFGLMHIINFAHGEIYMLGAFSLYYLFEVFGLGYPLSFILSVFILATLGMGLERFFFRPLSGKPLPGLICGLGLSMVLQGGGWAIFGIEDRSIASPFASFHVGNFIVSGERFYSMIGCFVLIVACVLFIEGTKIGRAMRAVEQNPNAAVLQGISIGRTSQIAFLLGCALAALAGTLTAPIFSINPAMGVGPVMMSFAIIIIGGMGSIMGTIIAGFIIGNINNLSSTLIGPEIGAIVVFLAVIVVILIKPEGLFGHE